MPLLGVNAAAVIKTFDHACANCGQTHLTQPLASLAVVNVSVNVLAAFNSMSFACPACGAVECFNTALSAADEGTDYRGQQAQRIRALLLLVGLPRSNSSART